MVEEMVSAGAMTEVEWDPIDRQCLDVVVSLLDYPLRESLYENVVISGLALIWLRPDGGWVAAEDYCRPGPVRAFSKLDEDFHERLLVITHLVGGQPGRTSEILGLRMRNAAQGGLRNIYIQKGMVCFVTTYPAHDAWESESGPVS